MRKRHKKKLVKKLKWLIEDAICHMGLESHEVTKAKIVDRIARIGVRGVRAYEPHVIHINVDFSS